MSKELVSLSHDRSAWNSLQGLETRHHDDKLTAEQAANINRSFDVFVVPVRHGYGTDIDPNAIENGNAPSHESYLQVEEIIDEMRPGDVLFAEGVGLFLEAEQAHQLMGKEIADAVDRFKNNEATDIDRARIKKQLRLLQEQSLNYEIDSIEYGWRYAYLHGVDVVFADADAYELERIGAVVGHDGQDELGRPVDHRHREQVDEMRERRAVNTVKDTAVDRLNLRPAHAAKVKFALIFGSEHGGGLLDKFKNLGINAEMTPEDEFDEETHRRRLHLIGGVAVRPQQMAQG